MSSRLWSEGCESLCLSALEASPKMLTQPQWGASWLPLGENFIFKCTPSQMISEDGLQ